jgi:4-phytase/acid phosphatase/peptide/nickel transport system substrate-binding protein
VAFALLALMSLFAVACGSKSSSGGDSAGGGSADTTPDLVRPASGPPKTGGKLIFGVEAETDGWDPTQNRWAASGTEAAQAVMEPLSAFDADFKAQPYLAESFTPNADFTQWDIKVRSGITFHNGEPLDAAAIQKFLTAFKASTLTGAAARPIESNMEIIDPLTLRLHMSQPWASFPTNLTAQGGTIPAPTTIEVGKTSDAASRTPVGTGPFVFKSWEPDKSFQATKYADYWRKDANGTQLPYLDEVDFNPIPDATTRLASIKSGDVNVTTSSDEITIRKMLDDGKAGTIQVVRATGVADDTLVLINTTVPPLDDIRVRQAMAYAIDKESLDQVTQTDPALSIDSVFAKDSPYYADTGYPTFDLDKAKGLVASYQAEKGPVKFTFGTVTDPVTQQAVQAIQSMWKSAGMDVTIQGFEQSAFIANAVTGKYTAQIWRQFGAQDPDGNYVWFAGANATGALTLNMARNVDPKIDTALNAQRATPDENARKEAWATIQQQQTADLPYLWLSHVRWALAASNSVRGLDGGTLPDGSPSMGFNQGVIRVTQMWMDN